MQVGSRQSSVDGLNRQSESPVDSRQSRVPDGHARSGYPLKANTRVSTATSLMRKVLDIAAVPDPYRALVSRPMTSTSISPNRPRSRSGQASSHVRPVGLVRISIRRGGMPI